ncbi:hypothetical protein BKA62DRAFT_831680 [Auriculariales sp. MPI-PUGE-AT-0066]|nr:hypothetical protein BKA62DRAFT_831680 [Auriculariales sp. MPI-PUGE-AT-0066]
MSTFDERSYSTCPALTDANFVKWKVSVYAILDEKALRDWLSPTYTRPVLNIMSNVTDKDCREWDKGRTMCCAKIYRCINEPYCYDFADLYMDGDPIALMAAITARFGGNRPGLRFNLREQQGDLEVDDNETLDQYISRQDRLTAERQASRPAGQTLLDEDKEFQVYCVMKNYAKKDRLTGLVASIHANAGVNEISLEMVKAVSRRWDDSKLGHTGPNALFTKAPTIGKVSLVDALKALHKSAGLTTCLFCDSKFHTSDACNVMAKVRESTKNDRIAYNEKSRRLKPQGKPKAHAASVEVDEDEFSEVDETELANFALTLDVRHYVYATSAELRSSNRTDWNTDTGCSAHMTARREFFRTYLPYKTGINLADGRVIYSEGVGSVVFVPKLNGLTPLRSSSTTSCMYLTWQ